MNNNRGNNRRRGRGNNRQGGGGQQVNRIDSRARGNAPQLLEKYRKLAHDAHLNGDRVQEEYYLQFADHYFRVIADTRLRQEELQQQRGPRPDRWQDNPGEGWREEGEDQPEAASDGEDGYEQSAPRRERPDRFERPERGDRQDRQPRRDREDRQDRAGREAEAPIADHAGDDAGEPGEAQANPYEPAENPFLRESRGSRGLKPRREDRRPRRSDDEAADDSGGQLALDPASLPPAISAVREEAAAEEAPVKRPRGRPRKKPVDEDNGEAVESAA